MDAADPWCEPERVGAEEMLYLLYTSGSTARPKGILHTSGGYLLGAKLTHKLVFDIKEDDVYWCAADIGWVTGHSYIVYGPLANHTTGILYEGAPEHPGWDRHWEIIERHGVSIYYTAPTAIRAFVKAGRRAPRGTRPLEPAPARHRRRADQSRGLDLVPRAGRRRALPDRRHLVADGDGRDHDLAASGRDRDEARLGLPPAARHPRRDRGRAGQGGAARRGRLPHAHAPVAGDAADALQGRRALRRRRTGSASARASTSRATAPSATRTATTGCSAASTT